MNETNETIQPQREADILETLRFPEISVEQLLHIRLMHTNFLLKDTTLELGRTKATLTQTQNACKNLKEENKKLREQLNQQKVSMSLEDGLKQEAREGVL